MTLTNKIIIGGIAALTLGAGVYFMTRPKKPRDPGNTSPGGGGSGASQLAATLTDLARRYDAAFNPTATFDNTDEDALYELAAELFRLKISHSQIQPYYNALTGNNLEEEIKGELSTGGVFSDNELKIYNHALKTGIVDKSLGGLGTTDHFKRIA